MKFYRCINHSICFFIIYALILIMPIYSKNTNPADQSGYQFKIIKEVKRTSVKDQYKSSTCWSYATISFFESELMRMGKKPVDLSEMYVVRQVYPYKAQNYIRLHGKAVHSTGGHAHDVLQIMKHSGLVPQEIYPGMISGEKRHDHREMFAILEGILHGVLNNKKPNLTNRWLDAYQAVLDVYLGVPPKTFFYEGKNYSPLQFSKYYLELNPEDYIEMTSYLHMPFYQQSRLMVPDNWNFNDNYYNIPIDDLEKIIDHALDSGYSVVWGGDVTEKDCSSRRTGYAVVPEKDWEDRSPEEQEKGLKAPVKEKNITQKMREETFANFSTTDDHIMHIVGIAKDQKGTKFYLTKNSHGTERKNKGYMYLSRSFVRLKTIFIMVNKHSLPEDIKKKLNL